MATCCTASQLDSLASSLAQAESLIATCPACRNNFRRFYCSFTCSPNQSQFLDVTATQNTTTRLPNGTELVQEAVKSISFYVGRSYGQAFFDSCKDVKFGATNGYAMDLLGGGAKSYAAFLRFMGQERALGGSPFQIDFPDPPSRTPPSRAPATLDMLTLSSNDSLPGLAPFDPPSLNCASPSLSSRCACPDCPAVCASLPPLLSPRQKEEQRCRVGLMSCFSFFLVIAYAVVLIISIGIVSWRESRGYKGKASERLAWKRIKERSSASFSGISVTWSRMMAGRRDGYDRLATDENATALHSQAVDTNEDNAYQHAASLSSVHSSADDPSPASPADSIPLAQPRLHPLTSFLSSSFYSLGFYISSHSYLVIALALAICGVVNLGWDAFSVERDPVKLWVAEGSQAEKGKRAFDAAFGETWRSQQVFVWANPPTSLDSNLTHSVNTSRFTSPDRSNTTPVLSYDVLLWWEKVEADIRALKSPSGIMWGDVCFNPSAPTTGLRLDSSAPTDDTSCVIQSMLNYFVEVPLDEGWRDRLNDCVTTPAACLGPNGPMNPKLILGGIPSQKKGSPVLRADLAQAFIVTYVLSSSKADPVQHLARSIEWEETLQAYLLSLSTSPDLGALDISLTFSTGVSLEEEINREGNTDAKIVVLSYVCMFLYIALNLGRGGAASAVVGAVARVFKRYVGWPKMWGGKGMGFRGIQLPDEVKPVNRRRTFVESKFLLGSFVPKFKEDDDLNAEKCVTGSIGILIVLLSVSTSVALFSALGIKVTLIIAEVIPFLVLAIGVDNVSRIAVSLIVSIPLMRF